MAFRRKRTTKRRFAKKRTFKKRGARRPAIKKMIRREIARNIENKGRQHFVEDHLIQCSTNVSGFDASIFPVGPAAGTLDIQQGPGQGARIGNQIKTKRLMFKGTIVPLAYNASTNPLPQPIQIKMWLFYNRILPTFEPTPAALADFFQDNNSSEGFSDDLVDLWKPVNTDNYRVLATRIFKVGNAMYNTAAGGSTNSQFGSNNDFKLSTNFSIDCTKMIPKITKYNDNNSDPTTRNLYCMMQVVRADGGTTLSNWVMARCSYMLDYTYEDA